MSNKETPQNEIHENNSETISPNEAQERDVKSEAKKDKKDKKASHAELAALSSKAEKAEQTAAAAKDALLRTAAEFDNFRKRSAREKDEAFGNGVAHAVNALLPVLDTLEFAENAATVDEEYKKGVTMTLAKCTQVFADLGIEEIQALDKQFDPELHSAVMQQPSELESGTIINVLQKGYSMKGKIIRHSTVVVAE